MASANETCQFCGVEIDADEEAHLKDGKAACGSCAGFIVRRKRRGHSAPKTEGSAEVASDRDADVDVLVKSATTLAGFFYVLGFLSCVAGCGGILWAIAIFSAGQMSMIAPATMVGTASVFAIGGGVILLAIQTWFSAFSRIQARAMLAAERIARGGE